MLKSKTVFTICIALLFALTSPLFAFDENDVQKLLNTNKCERCDLSGASLSDANLSVAIWTNGSKCKKGSIGECKR